MLTQSTRTRPAKRAANLTLSSEVLDEAKTLNLNVSQICDAYLREYVRQEKERQWRIEHAEFIKAYNTTIETDGLPLEAWRTF